MEPFTVTIEGGFATMARGDWSQTVAVSDLPKWLTFYRNLAARPGRAKFYDQPVRALEAACITAGAAIPAIEADTKPRKPKKGGRR